MDAPAMRVAGARRDPEGTWPWKACGSKRSRTSELLRYAADAGHRRTLNRDVVLVAGLVAAVDEIDVHDRPAAVGLVVDHRSAVGGVDLAGEQGVHIHGIEMGGFHGRAGGLQTLRGMTDLFGLLSAETIAE